MPTFSLRGPAILAAVAVVMLATGVGAGAQGLPSEPLVFGDGRVTLAGDVSVTYGCAFAAGLHGCAPDEGYFNYSSYDNSLFRNLRVNVVGAVKASERLSVLTEVRSDNLHHPTPYALYLRFRPWPARRVDIQAGRIPPVFGAFSRRPYPADNLLIGYPLAYQYLTSLRADALPANVDELLRMRGRGWLSAFSVGDLGLKSGLPIVDGLVWDTGVQVRAATTRLEGAAAVTTGTLGHPLVREDNAGKQVSARLSYQPITGVIVGTSVARGPYAAKATVRSAGLPPDDRSITQEAWGLDAEFSRGHLLVRTEAVMSAWRLPALGTPAIARPLRARAVSAEGRYTLRPGLYAAVRWDHLTFNDLLGSTGPQSWEAPVTRVEAGAGYAVQRNVLLKVVYQRNDRDGGRYRLVSLGGAQLVYWF